MILNNEYKSWLKKEIEKADKAERTNDETYQLMGMPRYARAREKAEYLGKALRTALTVEEGGDEKLNQTKRFLKGLRDTAKDYQASMPPEQALEKIIEELTIATLFGK